MRYFIVRSLLIALYFFVGAHVGSVFAIKLDSATGGGAGGGTLSNTSSTTNIANGIEIKTSGTISPGKTLNVYIPGPLDVKPASGYKLANYGCGNINIVADGNIRFASSVKQHSSSPDSNLALWTPGNVLIDSTTVSLDGTTFGAMRSSSSSKDVVTLQLDASMIGTNSGAGGSLSTFGPSQDLIQPNGSTYVRLGTVEVNGMVAMGSAQNFKSLSGGTYSGFNLKMNYPNSLKSNPPESLKAVVPDSDLSLVVIGSSVEYTDTQAALKFVGAE